MRRESVRLGLFDRCLRLQESRPTPKKAVDSILKKHGKVLVEKFISGLN